MKIIISQLIEYENDNFPHFWRKEYESDLIPVIGMSLEDSFWKNPYTYKIIEVSINYEENYYYVEVEKFVPIITKENKENLEKGAKFHGWKTNLIEK